MRVWTQDGSLETPIPAPHWSREKVARYRDEAILIHQTLKDASPLLAARLSEQIDRYGHLAHA